MAPARHQRGRRALVLLSLPQCCVVCAGTRTVQIVGASTGPCPHCVNGVPVAHLPIRTDHPRGAA